MAIVLDNSEKGKSCMKLLDLLNTYKNVKHTKLCSSVIQILVLALFLKDKENSNEVTKVAIEMINKGKELPKALKHDLFCLIGRKVIDQVHPSKLDENQSVSSGTSLIMKSNLLSGGLQAHLYGYFTTEQL